MQTCVGAIVGERVPAERAPGRALPRAWVDAGVVSRRSQGRQSQRADRRRMLDAVAELNVELEFTLGLWSIRRCSLAHSAAGGDGVSACRCSVPESDGPLNGESEATFATLRCPMRELPERSLRNCLQRASTGGARRAEHPDLPSRLGCPWQPRPPSITSQCKLG